MRFIDNSKLHIDNGWKKLALDSLTEARNEKDSEERAKYINSKSGIWKKLKPELEKLSYNKCWYCESRERRSDRAVDHYRPKNSVAETDHDGYWWLAFSPDNYRLSCTYCNSRRTNREGNTTGGKGDCFPVWDENKRVCIEKDDAKCKYEDPLLLDPCKRSDVALLWFSPDGSAVPKYSLNDSVHANRRAEVSIALYHLNEKEIKEARQALLYQIEKLIEAGDFYFQDYLDGEPNAEKGISETISRLERLQQPDAEYSAFAKATILGLRKKHREWLEAIG
jgi:hypothetical protein